MCCEEIPMPISSFLSEGKLLGYGNSRQRLPVGRLLRPDLGRKVINYRSNMIKLQ